MSRPQKMHKLLKGDFNEIFGAVAIGKGKAKRAALKNLRQKGASKPAPKKP